MFVAVVPRPAVPLYAVHQYLWGYYPGVGEGEPRPFLWRDCGRDVLLLSRLRPACPCLEVGPRIEAGRVYQFTLLASPMNGYKVAHDTRRGAPRRSGGRKVIEGNEARRAWFARRLGAGADPTFAQVYDRPTQRFRRPGGDVVMVAQCEIKGTLMVRDRGLFVDAMLRGIGGRGCWGCGLLVLPEVMRGALGVAA